MVQLIVRRPPSRTRRALAGLVACGMLSAACTAASPVEVEESNQMRDGRVPNGPGDSAGNPPNDLPITEAPGSAIAWGACERYDIPPADAIGTAGWECAELETEMDPFGDVADAGTVALALTRHSATGDRRGAILLNPGGPGGAGLNAAWGTRGSMPADILRSFDIVSWDPRGVGQSTPGAECDSRLGPGEVDFIARCVQLTGPLSGFLSAPYSAADMESIRIALGEDQLNFLGYSYGSVLGATYAAAHPERVGAFVLDGVTDPLAGSNAGPFLGTFATFADDGLPAARARFAELCNTTSQCLDGRDAVGVLAELELDVGDLPTDDFDGQPDRIEVADYLGFVESVLTFAGDWELAATALSDAEQGEASAMAALISGGGDESPEPDQLDADGADGRTDFSEANYMIYCADFAPLLVDATFCNDMAENVHRLAPVAAVELERDMLIIGTEFDPITPGFHAPEFASAIGDATHIIWDGVGHTAFPGWTSCIDNAVADQFLRRLVPTDGTRCDFLDGVDNDLDLADELFGQGDGESKRLLEFAVDRRALGGDAPCLVSTLNSEPAQVISHVILDLGSDVAIDAVERAEARC